MLNRRFNLQACTFYIMVGGVGNMYLHFHHDDHGNAAFNNDLILCAYIHIIRGVFKKPTMVVLIKLILSANIIRVWIV